MLKIYSLPIEAAFRAHIELWLKMLSLGNWSEALGMLDEPNIYGVSWSKSDLLNLIGSHLIAKQWSINDPATLDVKNHTSFGKFDDASGYYFDYDIPLNGEWSDLTAQFEFIKRKDGYAMILHDIHVL